MISALEGGLFVGQNVCEIFKRIFLKTILGCYRSLFLCLLTHYGPYIKYCTCCTQSHTRFFSLSSSAPFLPPFLPDLVEYFMTMGSLFSSARAAVDFSTSLTAGAVEMGVGCGEECQGTADLQQKYRIDQPHG